MKRGLVLGKFMPLHKGHLALFDFAANQCDELYILLCYTNTEIIKGEIRKEWIKDAVGKLSNVKVIPYLYDESVLPNTSVSSQDVSLKWSKAIKEVLPQLDYVITSEPYGDFLAEFLNVKHIPFDFDRKSVPVSSSLILTNPLFYWEFITENARPYFVKKIVLLGTESTGKSTLTKNLAIHFNSNYVPEMAREIIEKTEECKPEHLIQIAELHAKEILTKIKSSNKLLFIDTDINITKSYSKFLFKEPIDIADWIEEANKADLFLL